MKNYAIHSLLMEAATRLSNQPYQSTPSPPEQLVIACPESRRHIFRRPVRLADIDAHGHVNNVCFLEYLEDARVALFFDFTQKARTNPRENGEAPMLSIVIARHEVDYKRPLQLRHGTVRVESWVTKVGQVRCELAAEIRDDEEVFAEARSLIVAYNTQRARLRRFTTEERAFLEHYLA